ncbi:transcription factor BIM2-like isoform X2 [Silene latifolia]|uniref:transcription factor BIM2-like isoform X2 n=1 Tax=Silene latifolia TaxID=37657 RepID=UPI003D7855F0
MLLLSTLPSLIRFWRILQYIFNDLGVSQYGEFLRTRNFLQPLEGGLKNDAKEDNIVDIDLKLPSAAPSTRVVEHVLPGGIGTYSISCLPYTTQKVPKSEENGLPVVSVTSNDINDSNFSSYTGGSFILLDESTTKKGHSRMENLGHINLVKDPAKIGQWPSDWPSQSSFSRCSSVNPLTSSQVAAHKNQSFVEMLKSAKQSYSMEEEDEEDVSIKKEPSTCQKGRLEVKVDRNNSDQKANTPRSKHSATEQRRRCKINDRFQMLRELIPDSDQKRDKASFLLEVIEYIQYLQEKVNRYEGPHSGLNSESARLNPRNDNHRPNGAVTQPLEANGVTNPVLLAGVKLDEKTSAVPLNIPWNDQTQIGHNMINSIDFKTTNAQSVSATKAGPISSTLQANIYTPLSSSFTIAQPLAKTPQLELWQCRTSECPPSATGVKLKDRELALDGGSINISTVYSQGLLNTLTCALQNSGVDLSQASIAVQVDVGKRADNRQCTPDSILKSAETPSNDTSVLRGRVGSIINESDHAIKKLKTG